MHPIAIVLVNFVAVFILVWVTRMENALEEEEVVMNIDHKTAEKILDYTERF